ncbi:MAG: MltR family transcriptional regulator [Lonepinella koalarum]|nr:MltR family transcriptional regulator [Lonepinella koalarum]
MLSEDPIYEKLNDAVSVRGFMIAAVAIFDNAVDSLINRVFRKTDFVVQSVIESLFTNAGPLGDLSVRLKVLLGLGVIQHSLFVDVHEFIQLKEQLNNDEKDYAFDDEVILSFLQKLTLLVDKSALKFEPLSEDKNSLTYQMKSLRREKLIRSCLSLTIADIYAQLQIESPL